MISKTFESPSAKAEIGDDGIVYVHFKEDENVELKHVKDQHQWLLEFFKGQKYYVLVQGGFGVTFDPEVREWARSGPRAQYVAGDAFVARTLAHRLMANFYLRYHKPKHPTKVFSSKEDAREWLLSLMRHH